MSTIRQKLVFLTGHRIDVEASAQEIGSLSKIGAAIAFASVLAALQFGVAGWFLATELHTLLRVVMAIVFSAIGAAIVLVLDRNFIYLADTRYETDRRLTYVYLGIRIFLITVIGSLSSQFTMPLFLKSELAIHSQDMKDGRFAEAKERFQEKYELTDKATGLATLEAKEVKLKKELSMLTPELVSQRNQVSQCFSEYSKKTKTTFAPDLDESEIINLYARDKKECERIQSLYREAYRAYVTPRELDIAQIVSAIGQAQSDFAVAKKDAAIDLAKATKVHEANINIASADVLSSLIQNNPGAMMKYALLTMLQLCLELMPIFLKLQAGQSPLGHRMAIFAYDAKTQALHQVSQSATKRLDVEAQMQLVKHEYALMDKKQYAILQEYESLAEKQKYTQELEHERLRQELEELKSQGSAYLRTQHQFLQTFAQAGSHFMDRVVMPTVASASKPFSAQFTKESDSTKTADAASENAKVHQLGSPHGLVPNTAS